MVCDYSCWVWCWDYVYRKPSLTVLFKTVPPIGVPQLESDGCWSTNHYRYYHPLSTISEQGKMGGIGLSAYVLVCMLISGVMKNLEETQSVIQLWVWRNCEVRSDNCYSGRIFTVWLMWRRLGEKDNMLLYNIYDTPNVSFCSWPWILECSVFLSLTIFLVLFQSAFSFFVRTIFSYLYQS